ncbi:hypothetical protein AN220_12320 [Streptomyces nanshensis]|nr:hypothetical protein AN220_12320 [Streptomyces nanshensis]
MLGPAATGPVQAFQLCSATSSAPRSDASSKAQPTAASPTSEPSTPSTTGPVGCFLPRVTSTGHSACAVR